MDPVSLSDEVISGVGTKVGVPDKVTDSVKVMVGVGVRTCSSE